MKRVFFLAAASSIFALSACGLGGDGSNDAAPQAANAPAPVAVNAFGSIPVPQEFENTSFPLVTGSGFLTAFANEPNTETQANGSIIQTFVEGSGRSPTDLDVAKIHFVARVAGEVEPFGSSYRDGAPVVIAMDQALLGWTETLKTMREGGKVRVALPSDLAFGERGMPGGAVGQNAVTVYDLELITVYDSSDDSQLAQASAELRANLQTFSRRAQEQQALAQQQLSGLAAVNRGRSALYLKEQAERDATIETGSGLIYEIVSDQGRGPSPKIGDVIQVHYRGTLPNGEVFDSSYQRGQPAEFELGRVIAGWNEALQLMQAGDVFRLYIPGDLAYGARGTPDGSIGPNQALVFDVELLKVTPAATGDEGGE
ncbi:MAG: FKBP-type peptidyl-prolyl cis-trans isomerase [Pseudomonadota bacterium]